MKQNIKMVEHPFNAAELYNQILKINKTININFKILSDDSLSNFGLTLWKRLFSLGHKISVYNKLDPAQQFKTFSDANDFAEFMSDDKSKQNYQFILTEANEQNLQNLIELERYRALAGIV